MSVTCHNEVLRLSACVIGSSGMRESSLGHSVRCSVGRSVHLHGFGDVSPTSSLDLSRYAPCLSGSPAACPMPPCSPRFPGSVSAPRSGLAGDLGFGRSRSRRSRVDTQAGICIVDLESIFFGARWRCRLSCILVLVLWVAGSFRVGSMRC